ncbi:MAG: UDP-N-acetylmuramoyl-L-alanine--D-glutamate ligase [Anaerolineae bacterium]|nr:UDP-N-acetylmuramoyl-L-alanine--D-glutamate ligase [Anaerolineae bacterium]MDW8067579.1 UDP-N-acetylmuramoyl-L-alanine--D-glutamate ligase [Anaerolineae bacterium]
MSEKVTHDLAGKRVVVLGVARQGIAMARFLARSGAQVTVSDLKTKAELADAIAALADLPVRYALGGHPMSLLRGADLICVSGGVPLDIPLLVEAQKKGIPLASDAQLFLERCPATVVGITGSAGKTTTTALVGEMCRAAGRRTWVGGNIGNPLLDDLESIAPDDLVVMELSSFQLELTSVSPPVAAVLNITPNHLDRHKTMEAYIAAKRRIVAFQKPEDWAVLGFDDANARALALATPAQVVFFSGGAQVDRGAYKTNGQLALRLGDTTEVICNREEVRLRGDHNLLNILAACALAGIVGVPVEAMRQVVRTFPGVEHRLEFVREWRGVQWYDDSIATAPERVVAALRSFTEPLVLLAGGRDKKLPWEEFAREVVQRVRYLITFGEAGEMIAGKVEEAARAAPGRLEGIQRMRTLEEAVEAAARVACPGDVVLLSPGGTSFDAFRDFAERGDRFKELVWSLDTNFTNLHKNNI